LSGEPRRYADAGRPEETIRLEAQAKALEKIIERELEILDLKSSISALHIDKF
jgi:hypothetical protein